MPIVDQTSFPTDLYTAAQVRELDRVAIEEQGIAGFELMQRAAEAAFAVLQAEYPLAQRLLIFCGAGNNAGDGYLLACLAKATALDVTVIALSSPTRLSGDALLAAQEWRAFGDIQSWADFQQSGMGADVIVDALFGTGLTRAVSGDFAASIHWINQQVEQGSCEVLALDIPSGLSADTGAVLGVAVQAAQTVTFIGAKLGLLTGAGPDCVGQLHFSDLALPAEVYAGAKPAAVRMHRKLLQALPKRKQTAHKNQHGHVLVIGGNRGMSGAARMTAETALRCGAGLVSMAVHPEALPAMNAGRPELMCHAVRNPAELQPLLDKVDVVAIGPGLGQDAWARSLYKTALAADKPMVLDADALNLLAEIPQPHDSWVLTPHPGEAGRLLASDAAAIQADRPAALSALVAQYGGTILLKGAGSLVASAVDQKTWLCSAGNPGMGVGGMGDVLTGIIAALLAQGLAPSAATKLAVWLHATAADQQAEASGQRGLLPMDLLPELRRLLNTV